MAITGKVADAAGSSGTIVNGGQLTRPPAFVVYMFGHLRSFQYISHKQRAQFDQFAEGRPYAVFVHTWTERDHNQPVWYRPLRKAKRAHGNFSAIDVLRDPTLNGLHDVMAAAQVDRHPGLPAFAAMLKVRHSDKAQCDRMRGMTCVSDAAQQLVELAHTHHMATTFLESKEWFVRLGKYRDTLPIVRTRPDVTFRTEVNERVSGAMPVVSFRPLDPLSSLLDDMAKGCGADRRCFFGYRGPWSGGWGDIAYAARSETIETIVSNLAHLADILSRPPRPLMLTSGDSAVFDARGCVRVFARLRCRPQRTLLSL